MFISAPAAADLKPPPGVTAQLLDVPDGRAGIEATLRLMRRCVKSVFDDPKSALVIRSLAMGLVKSLRQKDRQGEIFALHAYVRDHIRYVRDIVGIETIQTPINTVMIGQGDCDDKCTLLAALLKAIGHPCEFVAVGFAPGEFSHVYVNVVHRDKQGRMQLIPLETTEPWSPGRAPVNVKSKMRLKV